MCNYMTTLECMCMKIQIQIQDTIISYSKCKKKKNIYLARESFPYFATSHVFIHKIYAHCHVDKQKKLDGPE